MELEAAFALRRRFLRKALPYVAARKATIEMNVSYNLPISVYTAKIRQDLSLLVILRFLQLSANHGFLQQLF